MIDQSGFRENVGILLANNRNQVFWAKRVGQHAWQFPQGGLQEKETLEEALYRELYEEVGLEASAVKLLGKTKNWLHYRLPHKLIRDTQPRCIGQKQRWFLLRLLADEEQIDLETAKDKEFDDWLWVSYWYPLRHVVSFKKDVYRRALRELQRYLYEDVGKSRNGSRAKPLHHFLDNVN